MRADCKEQRSTGPHIGFMSIIVCPPAPVCKQCNAITIYNANTKQWQLQIQSQLITQIQNNDNNKCNQNSLYKYKTITISLEIAMKNTISQKRKTKLQTENAMCLVLDTPGYSRNNRYL